MNHQEMMEQQKTGRPLDGYSRVNSEREKFRELEGEHALPSDERHAELRRQALASFELMTILPSCVLRECFTSLQRNEDGDLRMGELHFGNHKHVRPEIFKEDAVHMEAILHVHPLGSEKDDKLQDFLSLGDQIGTREVMDLGAPPDLKHYLLNANDGRVYEFQQSSPGLFYHRTEIGSVADTIAKSFDEAGLGLGLYSDRYEATMRQYGQSFGEEKGSDVETPRPEVMGIPKLEF